MKRTWHQSTDRLIVRLLTLIGFGVSPLLFMACYGPAPTNYAEEEEVYPIQIDTEAEDDTTAVENT